MRVQGSGQDVTFDAAADLSSHQFKFVIGAAQSGNSQQARVNVSGANALTVGVLQNKPNAANLGAVVRLSGVSKLVVDGNAGAIAVGDPLKADANGKGVKASANKDVVGAIALEASTADGDIIEVMVRQFYISA